MLALLLWFGDFLLSVLHIRTSCEPVEVRVNVLVPFTASYGHFEYSDGRGGASWEDLEPRGSEVELWTGTPGISLAVGAGPARCGEGHVLPSHFGYSSLSHFV